MLEDKLKNDPIAEENNEADSGGTETILDRIALYTEGRVKALKKEKPLEKLIQEARQTRQVLEPFAFEKALKTGRMAFICEIKKASPSRGVISRDFPYLQIAMEYEAAGADAISVLTEPAFFLGSDSYLCEIRKAVSIPILRKDFIIDACQIYEAKTLGADAVLLICALLDADALGRFIGIADELGLSALVEVHSDEEVDMALEAGARIIGINNRDLRSFSTDLATTAWLRPLIPSDITVVSESGIQNAADIAFLRECGANAVLIGETFMKGADVKRTMAELKEGAEND